MPDTAPSLQPRSAATAAASRGRPVATSHAEIEERAFALFAEHGFNETTMDMIAREVGVGRRTLFRYFESKNDIPWGQFGDTLDRFRVILREQPHDLPLVDAIHASVLAFNTFDAGSRPPHRERMKLILTTPALQAHSALRYREWREVIAEFVGERRGESRDALFPQTIAQVSLALALSAYEAWLKDASSELLSLIDQAMGALREYLT